MAGRGVERRTTAHLQEPHTPSMWHASPSAPALLLQGALLFCLLLLAIWLPLLLFSSGAPTYQTPAIASEWSA